MAYETKPDRLKRLVGVALASDDFAQRADQAEVTQDDLVRLLTPDPDIWNAAPNQQAELDRLESQYTSNMSQATEQKQNQLRRRTNFVKAILQSFPALLVAYLLLWYFKVQKGGFGPISHAPLWLGLTVAVIVFLAIFVWYRIVKARSDKPRFAFEQQLEDEEFFATLRRQLVQANQRADEAIISQGLKPRIREILDGLINPPFATTLPKLEYSGLSDVFNSAKEIATDARNELKFLLSTMPGGSIGIAGPRGSGKSTLLKSACADLPRNLETQRIPLLTTSPVEYEGRDFILHLFSAMCNKILQMATEKGAYKRLGDIARIQEPSPGSPLKTLRQFVPLAVVLGSIFFVLGALIGVGSMSAASAPPAQATAEAAKAQPTATPNTQPTSTDSSFVRLLKVLDLKPGVFLTAGLLLLIAANVVHFAPRMIGQKHQSSEPVLLYNNEMEISREELLKIVREAEAWLKEIKFQQSYTTGWSGALKLPIGLEGGVNTAMSLAQQQLSLPDITKGFCDFVGRVARDFHVVIGIDELDKLESDEAAQRFLNEIKAIFGLPNVFYLISVSENAMSNFERRGLPFRDVFDSSFDNIVYVDYLKLKHAKRLIARRVIGMPPPFVHLCYCISGGLARDLVRTCRNLRQRAQEQEARGKLADLKALTLELVKSDLQLKLHALVVAAKKLASEGDVNSFLERLYSLENKLDSAPFLLTAYEDLMKVASPTVSKPEAKTNGAMGLVEVYDKLKQRLSGELPNTANAKNLRALNEELASYLYYCVTLVQFFSDVIDPAVLAKAETDGAFDNLARARQYLAINPAITRKMLDTFRGTFGMSVPNLTTAAATVGQS